ncbi:MAG TPA: hypothetical protein DER09_10845 [Prolixibacteraceae bacterium]|nr:hypothetical protein [Prolixibacteraceae bacterium]
MMELENLKKAWNKIPVEKSLDENQLKEMLGNHSKSMIDRIDRNIKIGFMILFAMILIFALDDFFFSPIILGEDDIEVPQWLLFTGVFSNTLIFTTFIYFAIKYYRVRKSCDMVCNLKETLKKIIDTLSIYKTLFYLALVALLFAIGSGFVTGIFTGLTDNASELGIPFAEVDSKQLFIAVVAGLAGLVVLVGSVFLFLRWGFRKLYGNYIQKLKQTLKELEEIQD